MNDRLLEQRISDFYEKQKNNCGIYVAEGFYTVGQLLTLLEQARAMEVQVSKLEQLQKELARKHHGVKDWEE